VTEYFQHLHPQVEDDVQAAADYYADIDPDLAERLADDITATLARTKRLPLIGPHLDDRLRHQVLEVFPYMVLYAVTDEHVHVTSLEHVKGDPEGILRRAHRRL
jgi:plasmid stabilization system protein ParE